MFRTFNAWHDRLREPWRLLSALTVMGIFLASLEVIKFSHYFANTPFGWALLALGGLGALLFFTILISRIFWFVGPLPGKKQKTQE